MDAQSADLGLHASCSPRRPRPLLLSPRRLNGNFEPCPQALIPRSNPTAFQTLASPRKLPPAALPAALRLVSTSQLQRPLAISGEGLLAHFPGSNRVGQCLGQEPDSSVLFPVRVDPLPHPPEAHLIPETFSPLSDSPLCQDWVLCWVPWVPAEEGLYRTVPFSSSPALLPEWATTGPGARPSSASMSPPAHEALGWV